MKFFSTISTSFLVLQLLSCGSASVKDEKKIDIAKYPQNVINDAKAYCKDHYTKRGVLDQRMYEYCFNEQLERYDELLTLESKYKNYTWIGSLKESIIKKWTKAGVTQWDMVEASLRNEVDAYLDLDYGLKNGEIDKEKYDLKYAEWFKASPEGYWSMIRYSLKSDK